jgi:uncharacterized protein
MVGRGTLIMKRTITFIVTSDCNFRCRYCYVEKRGEVMPLDVARRALDVLFTTPELSAEGVIFDFIGGEPLLEADLIGQILDYAHKKLRGHPWEKNHQACLTTNGSLYDTLPAQRLIASNRCLEVHLTIDGDELVHNAGRVYPDGKGTYQDVARNVPLWLKQFPSAAMSTKVTLSRDVVPKLTQAVLHLFDLGIPQVHANVVFENVWQPGDAEVFEEQLVKLGRKMKLRGISLDRCSLFSKSIGQPIDPRDNQNWCGCGKWMLAVGPSGDFYPCNRFAPSSLHREEITIGNVKDGIDLDKLKPFYELTRMSRSSNECIECEVASGCAWCVGFDYDETGELNNRSTHICAMHKARVRANKLLWTEN